MQTYNVSYQVTEVTGGIESFETEKHLVTGDLVPLEWKGRTYVGQVAKVQKGLASAYPTVHLAPLLRGPLVTPRNVRNHGR